MKSCERLDMRASTGRGILSNMLCDDGIGLKAPNLPSFPLLPLFCKGLSRVLGGHNATMAFAEK